MNRRLFLNSIIGTVASIPFFAKNIWEPCQIPSKYPYKIGAIATCNGQTKIIQTPGIVSITCDKNRFTVEAATLELHEKMTHSGLVLCDQKGSELVRHNFDSPLVLNKGDKITFKYHLTTGESTDGKPIYTGILDQKDFDHFIQLHSKRNKNEC